MISFCDCAFNLSPTSQQYPSIPNPTPFMKYDVFPFTVTRGRLTKYLLRRNNPSLYQTSFKKSLPVPEGYKYMFNDGIFPSNLFTKLLIVPSPPTRIISSVFLSFVTNSFKSISVISITSFSSFTNSKTFSTASLPCLLFDNGFTKTYFILLFLLSFSLIRI